MTVSGGRRREEVGRVAERRREAPWTTRSSSALGLLSYPHGGRTVPGGPAGNLHGESPYLGQVFCLEFQSPIF